MTEANRRLNIADALQQAHQELEDARVLLEAGRFRGAIPPAYYAAFYAARALLLSHGQEPRTHHGVRDLLYQIFVEPGILGRELSAAMSALQAQREEATYRLGAVFTREMAEEACREARGFIEAAEDWLRSEGWLVG